MTTANARLMRAFYPLRGGVDVDRLVIPKRYRHRSAAFGEKQCARAVIAGTLWNAESAREACLQFVHPRTNFVLVNRFPDIDWPVLVEFMRILDEKHVVGV